MSRIRSSKLADLLMQARYSPQVKKIAQLDACEKLLMMIKPEKEYSFEFVRTTLTGYRPETTSRKTFEDDQYNIFTYDDLVNDLVAYSEQLSKAMNLAADQVQGRFITVESLAKKYRVCTKTVRRWRDKGLAGRYLTYEDGKQRLVFSAQMVDFFVNQNSEQISRGSSFTRATEEAKQQIVDRLKKWAKRYPEFRQEAIKRTAKRFGRSIETVRTILVQAEQSGDIRGFQKRSALVDDNLRLEIVQRHKDGKSIKDLAIEFGRTESLISQVLDQQKASTILERKIFYIDSPEFHKPNAEEDILGSAEDSVAGFVGADPAMKDIPAGVLNILELYHKDLTKYQVLTAEKEQDLFRKYNFVKYLADHLRKGLDANDPDSAQVAHIANCLAQAKKYKNKLIRHNLRLVISTARKHAYDDLQMSEYVSEGNLILMNAVDKFDYSRGFKFSTYATWAIVKRFASLKTAIAQREEQVVYVADEILDLAHGLRCSGSEVAEIEQANSELMDVMNKTLDERERNIICKHYGVVDNDHKSLNNKPLSLRQLADVTGLSKERVRQIELQGLKKLRAVLSPDQFKGLLKL